jgi:hypothetical protein
MGKDLFRASQLIVYGWSKYESVTTVDYTTVSLVTLLIMLSLLIALIVFYVLINRCVAFPKFTQPSDCVGD